MKREFWNKLWKGRSGMTLAEVLAGMAISLIITATAAGLMIFTGDMFHRKSEQSVYGQKADAVADLLTNHLRYATDLEVATDAGNKGLYEHAIVFGMDGSVTLDGTVLFEGVEGRALVLSIETCRREEHKTVLEYGVRIEDGQNETLYLMDNVVRLVNLSLNAENLGIKYPEELAEIGFLDSKECDLYLFYNMYMDTE